MTVNKTLARRGTACAALLVLAAVLILWKTGALGLWREGLCYQLENADYQVAYDDVPGAWSVELDLNDLESNAGKVLYEDKAGCRIVVDKLVDDGGGDSRIFFRAHGVYDRKGGQLVSGCVPVQTDSGWTDKGFPKATASAGGVTRDCSFASITGLNWKDGNQFGFHLTNGSRDPRFFSWEEVQALGGKVTVSVTGLERMDTVRRARVRRTHRPQTVEAVSPPSGGNTL